MVSRVFFTHYGEENLLHFLTKIGKERIIAVNTVMHSRSEEIAGWDVFYIKEEEKK